jgi:adenosyl cobinamide kinase/adenosyl cobinamide phosphate guanylyltransferase
MITFLLGGARSGKSALAVELGRRHEGPVVFVATCTASDEDLAARIARHRSTRPAWPTVEEPVELAAAVENVDRDALVIVDCLTLWVSNLMLRGDDEPAVVGAAGELAGALLDRPGPAVVVSNEVGLGVHPESELGRRYRDLLGRANQIIAAAADTTLFVVAGRALRLEDPWGVLG